MKPTAGRVSTTEESEGEDGDFARLMRDALRHLHDPSYLRAHPLADVLTGEAGPSARGKRLHQLLLDAIVALRPGPGSTDHRPARRHTLLTLRYVEALEIGEVSARLGISRREYTRQHRLALDALVLLLQDSAYLCHRPVTHSVAANGAPNIPPAGQLPIPLTNFIGREQERAAVLRLIQSVRLVTLTGPPGTGKTRLALHLAAELSASPGSEDATFPDGVSFVPLASIADPNLVVSSIVESVGAQDVAGRGLLESLKVHLSGRHMLLVLDNFEHVLAAASNVSRLLTACPQVTILVTSREALRLSGEHEFAVPPLQLPQDRGPVSVEHIAENEAVRLYVERAAAKQSGFRLTERDAAAVSELCRRLDGLPLAIELAAARSRVFPPPALLQRLRGDTERAFEGGSLQVLGAGARDMPDRHATLHRAVDWSYRLLTGHEQRLFAWFSVFAGGWTLGAAEAVFAVSGGLEVLDGMTSLLDKSLVQHVEAPNRERRFTMLETIRQFGAARLADIGEEEDARRAHASYFVRMGREAYVSFSVSAQPVWLDRLEQEHNNMRAALSWLATNGDYVASLQLAAGLLWYWWIRGHISEGRQQLDRILSQTRETISAERAEVLMGASLLAMTQEAYDAAARLVEDAVTTAQQAGDGSVLGDSLMTQGLCALRQGDLQQAKRAYEESLALARELGRAHRAGITTRALGAVAEREGDVARAMDLIGESVTIHRELDDVWELSTDYLCLGLLAQRWGDPGQAADFFRDSLRLAQQIREMDKIAYLLGALSGIAVNGGEYRQAARLLAAAEALWKTIETESFRKTVEVAFPENERGSRKAWEIAVEAHLGDEWEQTRRLVRNMTMQEAVAYGLSRVPGQ